MTDDILIIHFCEFEECEILENHVSVYANWLDDWYILDGEESYVEDVIEISPLISN